MSHIVLSQFVIRSVDGMVDEDATVQKFRGALAQFVADRETEESSIFSAIENVLTKNVGIRTNMDFVTGEVARSLNGHALNWTELKDKAANYIRSNGCGEKDGQPVDNKTGEVLSSPRRYFVGKGRDGGVRRWTDHLAMKAAKAASAK